MPNQSRRRHYQEIHDQLKHSGVRTEFTSLTLLAEFTFQSGTAVTQAKPFRNELDCPPSPQCHLLKTSIQTHQRMGESATSSAGASAMIRRCLPATSKMKVEYLPTWVF